ncbi:MAG: Na(+)/H(+) antiporter subunit D [Candidatus Manganitrophaceae bacterium]
MIEWIHPSVFFFIAAILLFFVRGKAKQSILLAAPALALVSLFGASEGHHGVVSFMGQQAVFGRVDKLSLIFGYVFVIITLIGMVYALHLKDEREHIAALLYAGSALGVTFAGDLFTLFIFWEIMAFSSVFLVWFKGDASSSAAGLRYLLVHIFGGLCLLGGIVIHASGGGGIAFSKLPQEGLGSALILVGFLLNAAVPPLHAWLADAYPEATVTGMVFLSAFTTKVAIYTLVRGFPGMSILVVLGTMMAVYGVVYAMLENDIRRLLAYHMISQLGYMVVGVGIGTDLALNGAVALALTNIFYKGLLIMGMSAVFFVTGKRKGSELGGLYRTMPKTFLLFMIGGFSISGAPLLAGFISKSIVLSAAAEKHEAWAFLFLTLASAGTFLSTTLKLPYAVFLGEDKRIRANDPPKNMLLGMALAAAACVLLGVWPGLLYRLLPYPMEYHPYTMEHVVGSLQMLSATALGFVIFLKKFQSEDTISLDLDWFYRKGTAAFLWLSKLL